MNHGFIFRNKGGSPKPLSTTRQKIPLGGPMVGDLRVQSDEDLKRWDVFKVVRGVAPETNRFQRIVPSEPVFNEEDQTATINYTVSDMDIEYVKQQLLKMASAELTIALSSGFRYDGVLASSAGDAIANDDGVRVKIRDKDKIELTVIEKKLRDGTLTASGWHVGVNTYIPLLTADDADALLNAGVIYTQTAYTTLGQVEAQILDVETLDDALAAVTLISDSFAFDNRWVEPSQEV